MFKGPIPFLIQLRYFGTHKLPKQKAYKAPCTRSKKDLQNYCLVPQWNEDMSNNINASICSTKPGIDDNYVFHRANVLKNATNQGFISHVTRKDMNALKQCLVPN